jgi:hypothetical protein
MKSFVRSVMLAGVLLALPVAVQRAYGHCDGMDGPVVKAAQKALATGQVNFVLIWVQDKDEAEVRKAFVKTTAVRKLNPVARELADLYFFETVVRIHRAGEGEPYTGLKPAGRDLGPAIPAADKAMEDGSAVPLIKLVAAASEAGIQQRFQRAFATKSFDTKDVRAGREHVKAYIEFATYAEELYASAHRSGHELSPESVSRIDGGKQSDRR